MSGTLSCLNFYDVVKVPIINSEEDHIWPILGYSTLKVDDVNHVLLFRNNRYNLQAWKEKNGTHEPPRCLARQGRFAKETFSIYNDHPSIMIVDLYGHLTKSDHCKCGGQLLMDKRAELYCESCCLVYDHIIYERPNPNESAGQGAPMW
jgi:hypothetical protein